MSSTLLPNINSQFQERTKKSVPQIYPGAGQLDVWQKEEFVFFCTHPDGARSRFLRTRRRLCSSLI